jgi:D-glycero-D-manno-heptose 1,7-bisphosphate phosphatase
MTINKAIFLDRDGVINEVVYHEGIPKPSSPWNLEEFIFVPNLKNPLDVLKQEGYYLFIISNQPDIARGHIQSGTTDKINEQIYAQLPIDEIMVCPHDDGDQCDCRKPKPGMIKDLAKKYHIDLTQSYLIGDGWKDIEAGREAGVRSILVKKEYNKTVESEYKVNDLNEAVHLITRITRM